MKASVKTQGFAEMDRALAEFSKATTRNVLQRAGLAALEPMAEDMRQKAPVQATNGGELRDAITTGKKLGKRQKRLNRQPLTVEVYAGVSEEPGGGMTPEAIQQEFGNENHGPQPYVRPAWDNGQGKLLPDLSESLGGEIDKATARAQRKALKAGR